MRFASTRAALFEQARGGRITIAYGRDAADVALITEFGEIKSEGMHVWVELA